MALRSLGADLYETPALTAILAQLSNTPVAGLDDLVSYGLTHAAKPTRLRAISAAAKRIETDPTQTVFTLDEMALGSTSTEEAKLVDALSLKLTETAK